ncbi:MAG: AtpZ/AtpI family protein [Pseudomonadota bacterium]|nr:AtpZ/AtpI family protein [Pseudomonadota bacterium]
MSEKPDSKHMHQEVKFTQQVDKKVARKLKAQRHVSQTLWSGLGMMGMIGWSVSVPTLIGIAIGLWMDRHYPGKHSWALMMLTFGLILGCINAWHWVVREGQEIRKQEENNHD